MAKKEKKWEFGRCPNCNKKGLSTHLRTDALTERRYEITTCKYCDFYEKYRS